MLALPALQLLRLLSLSPTGTGAAQVLLLTSYPLQRALAMHLACPPLAVILVAVVPHISARSMQRSSTTTSEQLTTLVG
jgi:hypothetical protein